MLSRIASRVLINAQKPSVLYRAVSTSSSNKNASPAAAGSEVRRFPHDAPERDFVNYPPVRLAEEGGKLRIGLIPDEWFKAMYNKTGVMGPYITFWGAVATVFSKEIYVLWADTWEHITFFTLVIAVTKLYGKQFGQALDKQADTLNKQYETDLDNKTKDVDAKIVAHQSLESLPEANKLVNAAKREIVQLQLETTYRERLAQVYQEVKRRLDFQIAVQNAYKRVEREQALNYILGEVNKSIGPNQEKEAFQSGLAQLKALSQKHAGTI